MAFEDRSSPNAAASPSGESSISSLNSPNSPESTRTSPYTCTTIPLLNENARFPQTSIIQNCLTSKSEPFLRITSYALSNDPFFDYNRVPTKKDTGNESSGSSIDVDEEDEEVEQPTIQLLKYSIRNILQPDFGKNALQKTKKSTTKISFKPYEISEEKKLDEAAPPLGSLCQTVSQIGKNLEPEPELQIGEERPVVKHAEDGSKGEEKKVPTLWPAWVYCTRYSDRPSSGPRSRRMKKLPKPAEEKRPRTAFSGAQLARLKHEFAENRYLTEKRRQQLSQELGLNEAQIKIWFQNKRAKIKKSSGQKNPLAIQLMAQGLYNHSTVACDEDDMPLSP